jgi:hypothetical protein
MENKEMITPNQAKKIIKNVLDINNLPYTKLTARTIDFTDLARDSKIFVRIHGWYPDPKFSLLEKSAKENGFCVEA